MSATNVPPLNRQKQLEKLVSTFFTVGNYGSEIHLVPKVERSTAVDPGLKNPELVCAWEAVPYDFASISPVPDGYESGSIAWEWTDAELNAIAWELGRLLMSFSVGE